MPYPRNIPGFYFQILSYEEEKREDVLYGYPNQIASYPIPGTSVPPWFAEGTAHDQHRVPQHFTSEPTAGLPAPQIFPRVFLQTNRPCGIATVIKARLPVCGAGDNELVHGLEAPFATRQLGRQPVQ